ncbi:alginate lyase family protein [Paraflavitalea soli]|nr:alginate lyase family protein [Paraflavitalea soli]
MNQTKAILFLLLLFYSVTTTAQTFVHPGGLHTQADLDRMKTQVAAGAHPWIDSWNALTVHPKAQNTYTPAAQANMGVSRQRASADAVAAYLNALRWYISGDTSYAACSRKILNAWAYAVNQVPSGQDIPGLMGIAVYEFAVAAEILRLYPNWSSADFNRFKNMMTTYLYPNCHDFLTRHNNTCITHYWANWDLCNITAILSMGVLCDDAAKFNEAITYLKSGAGNGNITKTIPFIHPGGLGQWQETGRDQEHALLGVGMLASICQIAWNQGLDLYGYDDNRLLKGAEYTAKYNLWKDVPYTTYNNCDNVQNYWASEQYAFWGRGRLQRPIWEMIYNHYVVRKGLSAPNVKAMAAVNRPEGFVHDDNLGFGTLCYTLTAAASPYPSSPAPAAPGGLGATASVGKVWLRWLPVATANGYNVLRSTTSSGPYTTIATYRGTYPLYEDTSVTNGTTYYYAVSAINQAGTSNHSAQASATPTAAGALPAGWVHQDIGTVATAGNTGYANVNKGTFIVKGSGAGIGGAADGLSYAYRSITGDVTITARLAAATWNGGGSQKTGIMIRGSLAADAIACSMTTGDGGVREARFGSRSAAGGAMNFQTGNAYTRAPTWFRLKKAGNTVTAYQSTDGQTWFTVGTPVTVPMSGTCYVGLVVASNNANLNTTTFDNISVTGNSNKQKNKVSMLTPK